MFIKEKMMRSKDSIFLSYDLTFLFLLFFLLQKNNRKEDYNKKEGDHKIKKNKNQRKL